MCALSRPVRVRARRLAMSSAQCPWRRLADSSLSSPRQPLHSRISWLPEIFRISCVKHRSDFASPLQRAVAAMPALHVLIAMCRAIRARSSPASSSKRLRRRGWPSARCTPTCSKRSAAVTGTAIGRATSARWTIAPGLVPPWTIEDAPGRSAASSVPAPISRRGKGCSRRTSSWRTTISFLRISPSAVGRSCRPRKRPSMYSMKVTISPTRRLVISAASRGGWRVWRTSKGPSVCLARLLSACHGMGVWSMRPSVRQ